MHLPHNALPSSWFSRRNSLMRAMFQITNLPWSTLPSNQGYPRLQTLKSLKSADAYGNLPIANHFQDQRWTEMSQKPKIDSNFPRDWPPQGIFQNGTWSSSQKQAMPNLIRDKEVKFISTPLTRNTWMGTLNIPIYPQTLKVISPLHFGLRLTFLGKILLLSCFFFFFFFIIATGLN